MTPSFKVIAAKSIWPLPALKVALASKVMGLARCNALLVLLIWLALKLMRLAKSAAKPPLKLNTSLK